MSKLSVSIAYLSLNNPRDKKQWSGINYYIIDTLEKRGIDVITLYLPKWLTFLAKVSAKISGYKNFMFSPFYAYISGKYFSYRLSKEQKVIDFVFAGSSVFETIHLKTDSNVVIISDASLHAVIDYYEAYNKISPKEKDLALNNELVAIEKCYAYVCSSEWGVDPIRRIKPDLSDKIFSIPFGANIEEEPTDLEVHQAISERIQLDDIHLFFLGVDWQRKGGDIVLDTFQKLKREGLMVSLTICGCIPPVQINDPNIVVIPFLNKSETSDRQKLYSLFKKATLFFLPTQKECYGIVFAEASAFGLPVISHDTGGVSTVVRNGENGYILSHSSESDAYAEKIKDIVSDKAEYRRLCVSSRELYLNELNWKQWFEKLNNKLKIGI